MSAARSSLPVMLADSLWNSIDTIAEELGVDRDAVVSLALWSFVRTQTGGVPAPAPSRPLAAESASPSRMSWESSQPVSSVFNADDALAPLPEDRTPGGPRRVSEPPVAPRSPERPVERPVERVAEAAPSARAAQERVLQKAAELERELRQAPVPVDDDVSDVDMIEPAPPPTAPVPDTLVLHADGQPPRAVTGSRFLIGRGKHCDIVINSSKVSREHVAITREGDAYYIEDLGSSNGTWYDKKRITRQKIEDGHEFLLCSERVVARFE